MALDVPVAVTPPAMENVVADVATAGEGAEDAGRGSARACARGRGRGCWAVALAVAVAVAPSAWAMLSRTWQRQRRGAEGAGRGARRGRGCWAVALGRSRGLGATGHWGYCRGRGDGRGGGQRAQAVALSVAGALGCGIRVYPRWTTYSVQTDSNISFIEDYIKTVEIK